ncbi:hypothetical protein CHS0354_020779 [Potamilus streckersoni]|uniref:Uncharacterized protein n=1 Tax=Potamilus streckersoni TaxID=2493646 RepID=A0AAE0SD16_9BIVA|nr:hypothetical protein CHS0354_020779 [Potamilus streckersoni]
MSKTEKQVDVSGFHWRSYRATVRRKEVFTFPSCSTDVNFNQDLADPIYNEMETEWNRVSNFQLPQFLDKTLKRIEKKTRLFTKRLCQQVERFDILKVQIKDAKFQLELSFKVKVEWTHF